MFNKRKNSELRVVVLLLLVVLIVCISGTFLYKNISVIVKNVETSAKAETRHSLVLRQILIDIGEAENSVKSYNLTYDKEHLISFYNSISSFESKIEELKRAKKYSKHEKYVIDNITQLVEKRFELLKQQLYLDDEGKITDELNTISRKIDEAYKKSTSVESATLIPGISTTITPVKKESLFKKLFGKKTKTIEEPEKTVPQVVASNEAQSQKIQGELKFTVNKVKGLQLEKLAERKSVELQLSKEGQTIVDQIRRLSAEIEFQENVQAIKKIDYAKREMNTIKQFAIVFSVVISLLLIFVGYLITNYVRKKKEYELALITAKRSAEDLAKTKETFLANMSHEIKTPLNAIYGFTEQVLNTNLNSHQYEQLNIVKKSAEYLSKLVNNILSYSKIQAGKAYIDNVSFNIKQELGDIELLFLEQTKKKSLNLIFETDENIPEHINCDLTKFKQILFNLIGNAIKFTEKGSVEILFNKTELNSKPALFIQLRDTGIGINKEKLPELFNEYAQANSPNSKSYEGTGLGLVITKKLIEQMGGIISLESKERFGTTVKVVVPYNEVSSPIEDGNVITGSITNLRNALKGKNILIVDDEDFNRLLLKSILSKYKVKISEAADGNESILLAGNNFYDLIIMDIQMPDKNGIDACIEIRTTNKTVPIFASSAGINEEKISEYLNAGFTGFVHKPFTEKELLETLMRQLSNTINDSVIADKTYGQKHSSKVNISNLHEFYDNDEGFKKELIEIFSKSINNALIDITNACAEREWIRAADAAHKAMPPCKHFDADDLYCSFKYFESLRSSIPDNYELQSNLEQLKQEIIGVNNELKLYL
jgi:signal transduction histidine kinase/DNA-binding NarL/FixJ family response regulator